MSIDTNFETAARSMEAKMRSKLRRVGAATLNNQAFAARSAVQDEMRRVFDNPKPITLNSVMVRKADASLELGEQKSEVYIRDDVPGASTQPATYLLAEEAGGARSDKRSERALQDAGLLSRGQQTTPGNALPRDAMGKPSGPGMVQLLSRVKAFGEQGFTANANARTTQLLIRRARARAAKLSKQAGGSKADIQAARAGAFVPVVKRSGNEFFMMKSKLQDGFAGVFKLVGRGKVEPVLWFDTKAPRYKPRFPFQAVVAKAARASFAASLEKALAFVGGGKG